MLFDMWASMSSINDTQEPIWNMNYKCLDYTNTLPNGNLWERSPEIFVPAFFYEAHAHWRVTLALA